MRGDFEKRWISYLDGELSAGEAAAFDASLDAAGRLRVESELHFEQNFAAYFHDAPGCPDELWEKTCNLLQEAEPKPGEVSYPLRLALLTLAASVLMILSLGGAYLAGSRTGVEGNAVTADAAATNTRLRITENSVSDFAQRAQTPNSPEAIEQYLDEHNIRLALVAQRDGRVSAVHRIRLLGSCMGNCPKGEIVEILFDCDGEPAKLVLAKADSDGAKLIRNEQEKGTVARMKVMGDYVVGVVYKGNEPDSTSALLNMLRVKNERTAQWFHVNQILSTAV